MHFFLKRIFPCQHFIYFPNRFQVQCADTLDLSTKLAVIAQNIIADFVIDLM